MNTHAYEHITNRIIGLLANGTVPWHRPWKASTGLPTNALSNKPYRGINVFLLLAMGFESPLFLTFHQVSKLGGRVKKGEKASPVIFWKQLKLEDEDSGYIERIPLLRYYNVFNVSQCEGLNMDADQSPVVQMVKPEEIVAGMPLRPHIKHGMKHAAYSPKEDCVGLPNQDKFEKPEDYYSTAFHELVHSTGHEKRLKRFDSSLSAHFGSDPYSKEELVAEMGAAFLCGHADIAERTIDNSAAYLNGWLASLKNDRTLIIQAAAQAQKAADFILGRKFQEQEAAA